jgi:PAS domain S-box-containing protein
MDWQVEWARLAVTGPRIARNFPHRKENRARLCRHYLTGWIATEKVNKCRDASAERTLAMPNSGEQSSMSAHSGLISGARQRSMRRAATAGIMKKLTVLISLFFLAFPTSAQTRDVTVGVNAFLGAEEAITRWGPTIDQLNQSIEGYRFRLITYGRVDEMTAAAARGEFNYVITNPSAYVVMAVNAGAGEIASLVNRWQGQDLIRFGSVVFTRKEQADIRSLRDLRGKSLMATVRQGFGGWQIVAEEFDEVGVDPEAYLNQLVFSSGNQQEVVFAVRDGAVDAGVIRTGVLEKMDAEGLIDLEQFNVVASRNVEGFPLPLSTNLYPEWVFAELPKMDVELGPKIKAVLLSIEMTDSAAVSGQYSGWREPLSYRSVHLLLRELRASPYEQYNPVSFAQSLWQSRFWIAILAGSLLGLIIALGLTVRRKAELSKARGDILKIKEAEFGFQRHALDKHAIVSIADKKGNITYVNENFVTISGYTAEELQGQSYRILESGGHSLEFFKGIWKSVLRGETWFGEIENRRKDGSLFWVQCTIVPQMNDAGELEKSVSIRTDITQSKIEHYEVQLRQFFELGDDEIYMFDADTLKCIFANMLARETLGLTEEEIFGRAPMRILAGVYVANFRKDLALLRGGERKQIYYEFDRKLPDGRIVSSAIRVQLISPPALRPRFVASIRDITERVTAQEQAAQFKATLDHIDDEVYVFWPDTNKFTYANESAKTRLGLSEKEIFDLKPTDLEGGLSPQECDSILKPMIEGKMSNYSFVRDVENEDGSHTFIEYDISYVQPKDKKPRFIAILRDITEKVSAQEGVRQLSASLDLVKNEVYLFWAENFKIIYMNQKARERIGWELDEWHKKKTSDFISAVWQDQLAEIVLELVKGPEKMHVLETIDKYGTPLEISINLVEPEGEKPRVLARYRDISEQKKADKAKNEFVSIVSHELRTPLTSIKGALGLMSAGKLGDLRPEVAMLLSIAERNTDRLTVLINDLLDISKIDAGKMEFVVGPVNLTQLVDDALCVNRPYGDEHNVTFSVEACTTELSALGDPNRLMQVMDNLLSNAAKFSYPGGKVEVTLEDKGDTMRVAVTDHGIGIPRDKHSVIFERFVQVDSTGTRQKGGTGLGLNIAKEIIESLGGKIGFCSEIGKGSTFYFELPRST